MLSSKKKQSSGAKSGGKKRGVLNSTDALAGKAATRSRAGLPARDSIVSEKTFKSPKGKIYRILVTNEKDAYDKPPRHRTKRSRKQ